MQIYLQKRNSTAGKQQYYIKRTRLRVCAGVSKKKDIKVYKPRLALIAGTRASASAVQRS